MKSRLPEGEVAKSASKVLILCLLPIGGIMYRNQAGSLEDKLWSPLAVWGSSVEAAGARAVCDGLEKAGR